VANGATGDLSVARTTQPRGARGRVEDALGPDVSRWPWPSRRLSMYLDRLIVLEERVTRPIESRT
jgi:hypothetical protein